MRSIKESLQSALNEAAVKSDEALMKKGIDILDKLAKKYTSGSAGVFYNIVGEWYQDYVDELIRDKYLNQDEADVLNKILGSYGPLGPLDSVVFMSLWDMDEYYDKAQNWPDEDWTKKGSKWVMKFNDGGSWFGKVELKKLDPIAVDFFKALWNALVR